MEPPDSGTGSGNNPAGTAEAHGRRRNDTPTVWGDFHRPPALVAKVDVNVAILLREPHMDRPLRTFELSVRFDEIEE